ncbi:hypothetical protein [Parasitella parasitica]|uniref:SET domain-containing protein n=1 Tax=Parasitella parasitica TaxID=35722 RepID=A0A0B7NRV5_9FUNG|nr:hypothetical protein [Parasitella parasitica]
MAFPIPKSTSIQYKQKSEAPEDTGLIRCVCPSTEDDGFTIQCERCLVWQHAYCVHITHSNIPDHYLCDQCLKRKRPKLSKRITISKKKFRKLDASGEETLPPKDSKKKRPSKSRIISRYVHPLFKEARERWSSNNRWRQHFHDESSNRGPLLCDHGPFVTMDATTMFTKGVLMDTPVSNQGLFATRSIPALRYLMEVTGDILLKSEFKFDPINDFVILGTPLSHIMFYPTLDLCIDTRQFGNKARYIRRSCHPNAELRNVVLPQSREDKTIHLGLYARHAIEKGEEITISWNWQRGHIAWKENMNWHHQHKQKHGHEVNGHQVIDEEEERRRKATIKTMLDRFEKEFGVCACTNKRRCLIEHLKRQSVPPKEKPVARSPTVNIISNKGGRRESSVILLKPKSTPTVKIDKEDFKPTTIESAFVNNTMSKDTSDDELLDVEGDIDIGDDLPPPLDNAPPLLEDNSSDEENADLSSLSSLSSLSIFEGSANENSDDDDTGRIRSRKRKANRQYHRSSKRNATASSTTATILPVKSSELPAAIEKPFAPLPRKKLWMRDYLNKHNSSDPAVKPVVVTETDVSGEFTVKSEEGNIVVVEPQEEMKLDKPTITDETVHSTSIMEPPQDVDGVEQYTKFARVNTFDEDAAKSRSQQHLIPKPNVQQHPSMDEEDEEINVEQDVDSVMTEVEIVDVTRIDETNVFDMDEGELSDASTILLNEDDREQVYQQDVASTSGVDANMTNGNNTKSSHSISQQEPPLILKDQDISSNNSTLFESGHASNRLMDLVEAAILVSSAENQNRL